MFEKRELKMYDAGDEIVQRFKSSSANKLSGSGRAGYV